MKFGVVRTGVVVLLFCSFSILFLLNHIITEAKDLTHKEDFLSGNLELFLAF